MVCKEGCLWPPQRRLQVQLILVVVSKDKATQPAAARPTLALVLKARRRRGKQVLKY